MLTNGALFLMYCVRAPLHEEFSDGNDDGG